MAQYKYKGKTRENKMVKGTAQADDYQNLYSNLKKENIYVFYAKEIVKSKSSGSRLTSQQITDFSRQIATMISVGIPIIKALEIIINQTKNPKLLLTYNKLYDTISLGYNLGTAMEECKDVFPTIMINMYKSGEASGTLGQTAKNVSEYYEKEHKLNSKISGAMAYPTILLILTVVITIGIFTFVIPQFTSMYENMSIPLITQIMIWLSDFIINYWIIIVMVFALLFGVFSTLYKKPHIKSAVHKRFIHLPLFGKLLKIIYTARFSRTLSSLYASGLPMLEAINITSAVIGNKYIESFFPDITAKLRSGVTLSNAISTVDGFDEKLISTIYIGEQSGKLDEMLDLMAQSYEYESDIATAKLLTYVEPIMIIIMAAIIATIMLAIMLPIFSSYGQIG